MYLDQLYLLLAAEVTECAVSLLLILQTPVFVAAEIVHVLIVLLAIIFYYKVIVGQHEVGHEVAHLAEEVGVFHVYGVMLERNVMGFEPKVDAELAFRHVADGTAAVFALMGVRRDLEPVIMFHAEDFHLGIVVDVLRRHAAVVEHILELLLRLGDEVGAPLLDGLVTPGALAALASLQD